MKSDSKPPRWKRRAEDRPAEICAAALEVFAKKGFAAARLDEIARLAGVSKGTLYLYFEDKEALFRAVVRTAIAPNLQTIIAAVGPGEAPFDRTVRTVFAAFADNIGRIPVGPVAKMVIGESGNFPHLARVWHDEVVSRAIGAMTMLVRRGQERGEVRPGDPRLYAFTLMGPMVLAALWTATLVPVGAEPIDFNALAKQHADAALEGLLVERAG